MESQGLVGLQKMDMYVTACVGVPSPKLNVTWSPERLTPGENVNATCVPGSTVAGVGVIVRFPPPPPPPTTIVLVSVSVLPQSLVAVTRTW